MKHIIFHDEDIRIRVKADITDEELEIVEEEIRKRLKQLKRKRIKKKTKVQFDYHIVDTEDLEGPHTECPVTEKKAKRKHIYWCPYCSEWSQFYIDGDRRCRRCDMCGISDHDYYIRRFNNLDSESIRKARRKARRKQGV